MGTARGPQINVTPMIDILLVLIIAFTIVTLHKTRGLETQVAQQSSPNEPPPEVQQDLVLTVEGNGNVRVTQDAVAMSQLQDRLLAIFKRTARPVVFVRGKKELAFQEVVQVIDLAKGVGFRKFALMNEWGVAAARRGTNGSTRAVLPRIGQLFDHWARQSGLGLA